MLDERADIHDLSSACGCILPQPGHAPLLRCIAQAFPKLRFSILPIADEWYRVGGVVTGDGQRVAESLDEWAEAESGGDVMALLARHGDAGYLATAVTGRTHYLVAAEGPGPMEFVQVEVDEVQEVLDRPLFDPERIPDTLEDVIDPMDGPRLEPRPLGPARYVFRKLTRWAGRIGELTSEFTGDPRFRRFLEDWEHSSAAHATRFCDHWALTVVPYLDSRGDHKQEVRPLTAHAALVKAAGEGVSAERVRAIDHAAGYDMAWYFLMLTRNYLPYDAVRRLHREFAGAGGGVAYLPARDIEVLGRWIEEPYHMQPWGPVAGFRAA